MVRFLARTYGIGGRMTESIAVNHTRSRETVVELCKPEVALCDQSPLCDDETEDVVDSPRASPNHRRSTDEIARAGLRNRTTLSRRAR